MSVFDDLSKDWKENKGWPSDINTNSLKDKNKNVMENLIQIERKERNELRLGIASGAFGIVMMALAGIAMPVYQGAIALNPYIIIGFCIVAASLIAFMWVSKRVAFKFDESKVSKRYLEDAKEKLQNQGSAKGKLGITYTIQMLAGMTVLNYGLLSQFPETSSFWLYLMPFGIGLLALIGWKLNQDRKHKKEIKPVLAEIDEMLKEL